MGSNVSTALVATGRAKDGWIEGYQGACVCLGFIRCFSWIPLYYLFSLAKFSVLIKWAGSAKNHETLKATDVNMCGYGWRM